MFRKPRFRPNGPQPYVEEFVVKEVHPVLTHYVTNKVYRHVHQFPHQNDTVIRETIGPPPLPQRHPHWRRPPR
ncbi:hypothetical protein JCM19045_2201 [Bacillus sp. JCM 19045]|nr:hypothetical protein JCM19045_2201 [Bacillus sp. JCM 19045]